MVGAGGAARAVVSALKTAGAQITVVNRPDEMAAQLAETFQLQWVQFANLSEAVRAAEIIITALPPGVSVIAPDWLNARQIIMDANYKNSEMAPLAETVGAKFIPGTVWLTEQARPAFELFTGKQAVSDIPLEIIESSPLCRQNKRDSDRFHGRRQIHTWAVAGRAPWLAIRRY